MSNKEDAKKRTAMLKRLREEHQDTVERTQALLKEQNAIRKQIRQAGGRRFENYANIGWIPHRDDMPAIRRLGREGLGLLAADVDLVWFVRRVQDDLLPHCDRSDPFDGSDA